MPAAGEAGAAGRALPGAGPSWRERLLARRDRLLASPAFQRWAAAFPLTRPIARRRARALFDLCAGFVYSQVLLACVRLRLFEALAEGPQTIPALAQRLALPLPAAERLLSAAAALRLAERRGSDRFGLGVLGSALLGNPSLFAMIEHHAMLYADLADPVALLRGQGSEAALSRFWAYAGAPSPEALPDESVAAYSSLMAASQAFVAAEILDAYPLNDARRLLDIGGGDGAFAAAVAARYPNLQFVLFDLPAVARRASERFETAGLAGRARAMGGDFLRNPLPEGADVATLVRVVHDHEDEAALAILRAARTALRPGGRLLLAEPMAGTAGAEPIGDAYFGFYLLAMGQGRARTPERLKEMLRKAGFDAVRPIRTRTPLVTGLIEAQVRPTSDVSSD